MLNSYAPDASMQQRSHAHHKESCRPILRADCILPHLLCKDDADLVAFVGSGCDDRHTSCAQPVHPRLNDQPEGPRLKTTVRSDGEKVSVTS